MYTREAFRILLGNLSGERLVDHDHYKVNGLCKAVMELLDPLRVNFRLHFFKEADLREGKEWLVVKIETSAQSALPFDTAGVVNDEAELTRECGAALNLMQSTLSVLRQLELAIRMTPHRFMEIYLSKEKTTKNGLVLARYTEPQNPQVLVRSPEGHDSFALSPYGGVYQTLPDPERWYFKVQGVRRQSAHIRRTTGPEASEKAYGKEIPLFWGRCADRAALAHKYFSAMEEARTLTASIRPTLNAAGILKRLEWCSD